MKLLDYMPEVAAKSQIRFASCFQSMLLHAHELSVTTTAYVIFTEGDGRVDWRFTYDLQGAFDYCRMYGKDAQILVLSGGAVKSM